MAIMIRFSFIGTNVKEIFLLMEDERGAEGERGVEEVHAVFHSLYQKVKRFVFSLQKGSGTGSICNEDEREFEMQKLANDMHTESIILAEKLLRSIQTPICKVKVAWKLWMTSQERYESSESHKTKEYSKDVLTLSLKLNEEQAMRTIQSSTEEVKFLLQAHSREYLELLHEFHSKNEKYLNSFLHRTEPPAQSVINQNTTRNIKKQNISIHDGNILHLLEWIRNNGKVMSNNIQNIQNIQNIRNIRNIDFFRCASMSVPILLDDNGVLSISDDMYPCYGFPMLRRLLWMRERPIISHSIFVSHGFPVTSNLFELVKHISIDGLLILQRLTHCLMEVSEQFQQFDISAFWEETLHGLAPAISFIPDDILSLEWFEHSRTMLQLLCSQSGQHLFESLPPSWFRYSNPHSSKKKEEVAIPIPDLKSKDTMELTEKKETKKSKNPQKRLKDLLHGGNDKKCDRTLASAYDVVNMKEWIEIAMAITRANQSTLFQASDISSIQSIVKKMVASAKAFFPVVRDFISLIPPHHQPHALLTIKQIQDCIHNFINVFQKVRLSPTASSHRKAFSELVTHFLHQIIDLFQCCIYVRRKYMEDIIKDISNLLSLPSQHFLSKGESFASKCLKIIDQVEVIAGGAGDSDRLSLLECSADIEILSIALWENTGDENTGETLKNLLSHLRSKLDKPQRKESFSQAVQSILLQTSAKAVHELSQKMKRGGAKCGNIAEILSAHLQELSRDSHSTSFILICRELGTTLELLQNFSSNDAVGKEIWRHLIFQWRLSACSHIAFTSAYQAKSLPVHEECIRRIVRQSQHLFQQEITSTI